MCCLEREQRTNHGGGGLCVWRAAQTRKNRKTPRGAHDAVGLHFDQLVLGLEAATWDGSERLGLSSLVGQANIGGATLAPVKRLTCLGVLALTSALVPVAQARGATFYLAPEGDDAGNGSEAQPFFTLARAWQEVDVGDTIFLHGGTYAWSEQQYLQGRSGAPGMLINVWAVPGETPKLTMAADYSGQDLIYFEGDFVHWKGIELADFWPTMPNDFGWPAFRSGASNDCVYEQLDYHHNRAGFSLRGASNNNLILNSDFHHNADPADNYDGTDGLDVHFIDAGVSNTIRGCRAYWNGDDGFDLWSNNGHVLVEDSWAFFNGFIPDTFEEAGNGSGFKLGTANPSGELLREVHHNLSYRNRAWGFVENDAPIAMHLFNNTSAQNGGRNFWFGWGAGEGVIVRNNLAWGPAGSDPILDGLAVTFGALSTLDHNTFAADDVWSDLGLVSDADFAGLDELELLAPRQADGSLPVISMLQLVEGSDLVDAGVDVALPFNGLAPDLGAFEWGLSASGGAGGGAAGGAGAGAGGDAGGAGAGGAGQGGDATAAGGTGGSSSGGADATADGCDCRGARASNVDARFALLLALPLLALRRRKRR